MLTEKQKEADKNFRQRHPEKMMAKDKKRYEENRESELARNKAYYPTYYEKNKEEIKFRRRCYMHGCTFEWLESKLKEQDNRCAICKKIFEKTPHIDHDHNCCPSNKRFTCGNCNRDLLCDDCNLGLGRFKDDQIILLSAMEYLKKHQKDSGQSQKG
jgi:hypothetical protein